MLVLEVDALHDADVSKKAPNPICSLYEKTILRAFGTEIARKHDTSVGALLPISNDDSKVKRKDTGRSVPDPQEKLRRSVQSKPSEGLLEVFRRLQMRRRCSRLRDEDGGLRR